MKKIKWPEERAKSIEHWEHNLALVKKLKWTQYKADTKDMSIMDKAAYLTDKDINIYSSACPYCIRAKRSCYNCPLRDSSIAGPCCHEWIKVRNTLYYPTTRVAVEEAINQLIKYIRRNG